MINDIYSQVQPDIGRSLFADDGAFWKWGRNVPYIVRKVQEAIDEVERWAFMWGFRFSVEKTQTVFFTRRKVRDEVCLRLYGRNLERVGAFRFLGVYFDIRLTWAEHIERVVGPCMLHWSDLQYTMAV